MSQVFDADSIVQYLETIGIKISLEKGLDLSKRTSSLEGALDYYISNPKLFEDTPTNTKEGGGADSQSASAPVTISDFLREMGYNESQIAFAMSRCSSVEAAMALLSEEPEVAIAEQTFQCPMCICDYPASEMITLSCQPTPHRFCTECFKGYCESKISEDQVQSDQLVCPALNEETQKICGTAITYDELRANIEEEVFGKYERFSTRAFCEGEQMRRCPACNEWYVDVSDILRTEKLWKSIECGRCEHKFCAKCGQVSCR